MLRTRAAVLVCLLLSPLSALALGTGQPPPPPPCPPPGYLVLEPPGFGISQPHWVCVQPPPPVVRNETWFPGFKVVSLFYAPPGKQSSVSYGRGSSAGSSQATTYSTSTGVSYGGTLAFATGVSVDQSFTFGTSSGRTERIQKSDGTTIGLSNGTGASDLPDHGFDTFWIWTNPRVDLVYRNGTLSNQNWTTSDGAPPRVVPFTVREIQGLDSIPPYKRDALNVPFTSSDVELLLEMDPFLDPSYRPDPRRYNLVLSRQTLWGPDRASDPVPSLTANWGYTSGSDSSFTINEGSRTGVMVQSGFDLFGLIKAQARVGGSFSVTFTQGSTTSTASNESATVMLRSTTPCHAMDVDVYFDRAFNTFVALPTHEYSCTTAKASIATDATGKPLASQPVSYKRANGQTVQTYTDALGRFPVYQ